MQLHFLTKNAHKAAEFAKLFVGSRHSIIQTPLAISEIQTEDMQALVTDKAVKAFAECGRPMFVDHTGLYFELLNGFPGGLTEIFWNRLKNPGLASLIGTSENSRVVAKTMLGFCDGKIVKTFTGEMAGTVPSVPRGPEGFQWDPIFIPEGDMETFAEMGDRKNTISMRKLAVAELIAFLDQRPTCNE